MIVYDKEQKEIVIPNGIGNIDIYNNGVEAGYNQGYEQGQADLAAKSRVFNVTKNGTYMSKYSDPIISANVTGMYADGTEFYNYAELNGKIFNTKIASSENSRLEFWYKGDNTLSGDGNNVIIGSGDTDKNEGFQVKYYNDNNNNNIIRVQVGVSIGDIVGWDDTVWHHLVISKKEGIWLDGNHLYGPLYGGTVNGEFFINGIVYDVSGDGGSIRTANGCFGMIKIDDTIIIPTADGFLNTNTGELLEVVQDGSYTFTENPPIYGEGELYKTINVNVPDLNGSYDEGYAQGKIDGVNEQKTKLESISITENGTYSREDGYNHIEVNVPDLNGSYDEGYDQGQADMAAKARVLNVTENGTYLSKYSESIIPTTVTGVYADGTDFYSYALISNIIYSTGIIPNQNTRLEFWFKPYGTEYEDWEIIIGSQRGDDTSDTFQVRRYATNRYDFVAEIGTSEVRFTMSENEWHHIIMSVADGFVLDGTKIGDFTENMTESNTPLQIGGSINFNGQRIEEGYYGMIKIDDTIIIPTENGFKNVTTDQILQILKDGSYTFTENLPIYGEGELYKTINVNVIPKINVKDAGIKFCYSSFKEVPEYFDFSSVTDLSNMFNECTNLEKLPILSTLPITDLFQAFRVCYKIETIPFLDTSIVKEMNSAFWQCKKLSYFPPIDTSNVNNMSNAFNGCASLTSLPALNAQSLNMPSFMGVFGYDNLPNLTDFGGFLNLKNSLIDDKNLKKLPNLSYESCINVLNGLYDFTGNGETPNNNQGKLKVHQNFLDKVGDEISIGTAKGWQITV